MLVRLWNNLELSYVLVKMLNGTTRFEKCLAGSHKVKKKCYTFHMTQLPKEIKTYVYGLIYTTKCKIDS